ncbi:hypothetical protein Ga0466249_004385 [Sporomusaceae bacterium BoRhaA]|uniref:DUF6612 family protein n=1 Tax=Pelorhabdus rhamnosifermentans TaxID=2772457 RepID=UPI001FECE7B0|nr:DUF6612 family protein [Pelorhabdus rhamnosifermentans]MBU2703245.1 hypothetical protein [Pelorhabdus rhamnosifermentans]
MRKINWGLALVWGLLFMAMGSSLVFASEKLSPEKAYLSYVYQNMMEVNSVHCDITVQADTTMGQMKAVINGDVQSNPLGYKSDISIWTRDMKDKEMTIPMKQYLERSPSGLVVYTMVNEKWFKQIVPEWSPVSKNDLSADEKNAAWVNLLQMMKSVKLQKETPAYKYIDVTLDSMQISDAIAAAVKENNVQEKDILSMTAIGRMALLAVGDLTYTVKIDKATKMVTEVDMDLTDPIRKGANLFLDLVHPKDRAKMEDFLTNSTLSMQIVYSNYNKVDPIVIPQEVKDTAKEYKAPVRKAHSKQVKPSGETVTRL